MYNFEVDWCALRFFKIQIIIVIFCIQSDCRIDPILRLIVIITDDSHRIFINFYSFLVLLNCHWRSEPPSFLGYPSFHHETLEYTILMVQHSHHIMTLFELTLRQAWAKLVSVATNYFHRLKALEKLQVFIIEFFANGNWLVSLFQLCQTFEFLIVAVRKLQSSINKFFYGIWLSLSQLNWCVIRCIRVIIQIEKDGRSLH